MKQIKVVFNLLLGGWAMGLGYGAVRAADYYISPAGSDTHAGTVSAPFATLERARTEVRNLKADPGLPVGGVNVWLRGGVYARTNTFELSASDAGAPLTPVAWRGYTGELARVMGSVPLRPDWFDAVSNTSPVWARLDTNAQGHVMQADLAAHGITNYGTLKVRGFYGSAAAALELFFNQMPMPLARYPDPDEHEPGQGLTNTQLIVFGDPGPVDVTGLYVADGTADGVNRFHRAEPVSGKQYNLYRHYWQYPAVTGSWHRAWFLTTHTGGYPPDTDPWWCRYTAELGPMNPTSQSGSTGTPHFSNPAAINHGWLAVNTVVDTNAFTYSGSRPERWAQAEEPWFHGFWYHYWADQHQKGVNIDTHSRTITLGGRPTYGILAGQAYYAENLLEEITRPGEWYLNRQNGVLYFWPPATLEGADIQVSLIEQPLWRIKDSTDVVVRDITFDMARGDLVTIEGGTRNAFIHCTLRGAGAYAGRVSGTSNGVSSCTILHSGEGGVALSGASSRSTLVPVRNYVRNCDVRNFSRWSWTYQPAALINPEAVGCWVSHNSMYDSPHTAILFGRCNDNLVEFNKIGNVCRWSSDAGAIYIGRDWGARGNVIRYNFVHDVDSLFEGFGTHGIYLDDCQSGVEVFGNVLYRISDDGIVMGGGRDNIMENNIMTRCGKGIAADDRGAGWMYAQGGSSNLWADLQRYPYQGTLWSNAYPLCAAIPNDWPTITNGAWLHPEGSLFSRNLGSSNGTFMAQSEGAFLHFKEITNNLDVADPLFVDESALNLALQPGSPAYSIPGFQSIPFAEIGLETNKALAVPVMGSGSVRRIPEQENYYPMQFVTLVASPSNLWSFAGWSGAANATADVVTVWMTNHLAVTARFEPQVAVHGTPLWWLQQYGLPANDAGALADTDGDGSANWQEYVAGTCPTNPGSRLALQSIGAVGGEGLTISWSSVSGRQYAVDGSTNLLAGFPLGLQSNIPATPSVNTSSLPTGPAAAQFYRVRVMP